jgi:hypothetical protein
MLLKSFCGLAEDAVVLQAGETRLSWIHDVAADRSIIGSVLSFWTNFRTVANQKETSAKLCKGLLLELFFWKKVAICRQ